LLLLDYWSTSLCGENVAQHSHPKYNCPGYAIEVTIA